MDTTNGTTAPRRRPGIRIPRQSVWVLAMTGALAALTVAIGHPYLGTPPFLAPLGLPWWVFAVGFAATETFVFHIQTQREARTVSVSELPLVLGLLCASPLQLLLGRLVGSALVFAVYRRSSALKTTWNLALISLETVVAVGLFHLAAAAQPGFGPLAWLGAYAGAIVANCVGSLALTLVIGIYEGSMRPREILVDMVLGQPAAPIVVTVALVAVSSLSGSPQSAWLLLASGAGLLLGYRAFASLSDRHLNLERLYRFSQAVTSSPEIDEVLRSVLGEAKELLRSERAEVAFVASGQGDVAHVRLGTTDRLSRSEEPQSAEDAWLLARVVEDSAPLLVQRGTRDPAERRWLEAQAAREAVAVPLRGGAGVLGVLVVTDRLGEVRTYDREDVLLLETVANHASVALQNGELIDQLRHDALHDALTGLPNRAQLQRRLATAMSDVADDRSVGAAVMILDLDGFKEVNDTLGHQQGDLLLIEVGTRLTTAVGSIGHVARLGGDEFAILLPGVGEEDRAVHVGRRVLRALEAPIALDGMEVEVGGSVGIALAPAHATEPSNLLKRADMAMYAAKASSRGLRVYEDELDTKDPRRLTLVAELRTALQQGDITVHVQPKAALATGQIVGTEALVRWWHPELGNIPPDDFIPTAERSGLIGPLTTRVLDLSLGACAGWLREGCDAGVAVNLSARSLHDADLIDEVTRLLRRHDVPAHRLTLEVTESSVMVDPARAVALLQQMRDLGVRLSVDDFGTGYSSLSYLKRLPVHEVKIDRSFITGLDAGGEDAGIVRAIVDLGRHLGLEVVAEGVEDQSTWDMLVEMGCDLVQGWHVGRPMPHDQFLAWTRDRNREQAPARLRVV